MKIEKFLDRYNRAAKLEKIDLIEAELYWFAGSHPDIFEEKAGEIIPIFEEYLQFQSIPDANIAIKAGRCLTQYLHVLHKKLSNRQIDEKIEKLIDFQKYVSSSITQAEFYAKLCYVKLNMNRYQEAVQYGSIAYNLIGNQPLTRELKSFYSNFGMALIYTQDYDRAKEVLTLGLARNDDNDKMIAEKLHMHLGLLYRDQGDFKNALEEFLTAEKLHSPKDVSGTVILNINIASIYLNTGDYETVVNILEKNFPIAENNELDKSAQSNFMQSFNLYIGCSISLQNFDNSRTGIELMEYYMNKYHEERFLEDFYRLSADEACAKGDYDKALSIYEKAYSLEKGKNWISRFFLQSFTNFLMFTKNFERAFEINTELLEMLSEEKLTSMLLDTYELRIDIFKGLENYKAAVDLMERVKKLKKDSENNDLKVQIETLIEKNKQQQKQLREKEKRISLFNRNFVQEHNIDFVGTSSAIKEVIDKALIAAQHPNINVLICGESGTGKEVIAKYIHFSSQVDLTVFQEVNCSAIPETMLESEFFGYKKGAFTGAVKDNPGYIASSDKGTLFLDEIGDLPVNLQPKLLKVLEEKSFTPLGENKAKKVSFRLISATNRDLKKMVKESSFRDDLFNRINSLVIEIPPLRKRKADIIPLVEYFLEGFTKEFNMLKPEIDKKTRELLLSYFYPGNVRELKNIIERTMIFVRQGISFYDSLKKHGFIYDYEENDKADASSSLFTSDTLNIAEVEKQLILKALDLTGNHKSKAAKLLDITPSSLTRRLKKFDI